MIRPPVFRSPGPHVAVAVPEHAVEMGRVIAARAAGHDIQKVGVILRDKIRDAVGAVHLDKSAIQKLRHHARLDSSRSSKLFDFTASISASALAATSTERLKLAPLEMSTTNFPLPGEMSRRTVDSLAYSALDSRPTTAIATADESKYSPSRNCCVSTIRSSRMPSELVARCRQSQSYSNAVEYSPPLLRQIRASDIAAFADRSRRAKHCRADHRSRSPSHRDRSPPASAHSRRRRQASSNRRSRKDADENPGRRKHRCEHLEIRYRRTRIRSNNRCVRGESSWSCNPLRKHHRG